MEGHLFATSIEQPDAVPPFVALLVSGGHTLLLDVEAWGCYRLLGRTRDDAAGEAFDKVAKLLGLPYPGGPAIECEAAAANGASGQFRFARPMLRRDQRPGDSDYYDVSFSGLKTAVLNAVRSVSPAATGLETGDRSAIARAFQDALIETLVEKTARAVEQFRRTRVVLGGGVAGNRTLVEAMRERCDTLGAQVLAPTARLATDNAAMIARAGLFHLQRGERASLDLNAFASLALPGLAA
jgi:N6-L-threonylcarbamoyladenine synthase